MKHIQAIVVAGGRGERLKPLTDKIPKPMVKVAGKPILEYVIELLKRNHVTDIIIALGYLPEVIKDYFKDGSDFGVHIQYTHEDPTLPLGTAGGILPAKNLINGTFIVTYADIIRDLDVQKMLDAHVKSEAIASLNTYKHTGKNHKSTLVFDNSNTLTEFTELPTSTDLAADFAWSNGSFYIFEPRIFDYIQEGQKVDFSKDIFPALLSNKEKVSVFPSDGYFIDIGTIETLEQATKDISAQEK